MKILFLILFIFSFFNVNCFFTHAETEIFIKVIYSNISVYVDTDIFNDYNKDDISDVISNKTYGEKLKLKSENIIIGNDGYNYYLVKVDEEKIKSQLIMYCGVMFGVSGAVSGVRVLSTQIAKTTLHKLPQKERDK